MPPENPPNLPVNIDPFLDFPTGESQTQTSPTIEILKQYPPSVLEYLDNINAQLQAIYKKYNVKDSLELAEYAEKHRSRQMLADMELYYQLLEAGKKCIETKRVPEKEFIKGEIYDFILDLRSKTKKNITDVNNIHTQPNGTLAGRVKVNGKYLPFTGDALIETIAGKAIQDTINIHTQPNGTLAGTVKVDGIYLPFTGDTLIETIAGKAIEEAEYIHTQPDGTLAGRVQVNGKFLLFTGNTLIETIADKTIEGADHIHTQPNGTLAGSVYVNGKYLPFTGDALIETIAGKAIEDAGYIHTLPDGTLAGRVQVNGKRFSFLWVDEHKNCLFE